MTRDIFFCGTSTNYSRFWYFLDLLVLSPVSPPDNIFALPTEVFSSRLAIMSAVTVGGLFLWPSLRYGTGYQTVREIRPSAETPSSVHWRRFYFQLTCVHSALELSGRCALQIYILTYHWWSFSCRLHMVISTSLDFYLFNFAVCIVCSIGNYVSADVTWQCLLKKVLSKKCISFRDTASYVKAQWASFGALTPTLFGATQLPYKQLITEPSTASHSFPSARQHPSYGDCLEVKRILSELLCAGLCDTMFTVSSTLIWAVLTGPADSVCHIGTLNVVRRGGCLELYYCNMVEWCWWDSILICKTNWFPSVLWHCWFGHMTCKNCPRNDL